MLDLLEPEAQNHQLEKGSAQRRPAETGKRHRLEGWAPKPSQSPGRGVGAGWLLTLVTGQVWLIPELGRILDKLDVALALLHRGL